MFKKFFFFLFFLITPFLFSSITIRATEFEHSSSFSPKANHVMVIEVDTGKILLEKDSETVTGTASTSKLLTAYLVLDAIKLKQITWEDIVTVSNYAYDLSLNTEIANVPLDARAYTVQDLFNAMMVYSANGATVALAEHISGTEPRFVDAMINTLNDWGITDASIVNATGLSNTYLGDYRYPDSEETDENMMSARSLAIIAQKLLLDFPTITDTTSIVSLPFSYTSLTNWNLILQGSTYSRAKVDGLVTGTSEKSGSSIVTSSTENHMRVVAVILGAHNSTENPDARFTVATETLDYIRNTYYLLNMVPQGQSFEESTAQIFNGRADTVPTVTKSDFLVVQKIGEENQTATYQQNQKINEAPIKAGANLGTLTFEDSGYLQGPPTMEMVADEKVDRAIFYKVWWNNFVKWVNEDL